MCNKFIFFIVSNLVPFLSMAQQDSDKGIIGITVNEFAQHHDSVIVDIHFKVISRGGKSNLSQDYYPIIEGDDQYLELPYLSVKGRTSHKEYLRSLSLMSTKARIAYQKKEPVSILNSYKKGLKEFHYRQVLPYKKWMGVAKLVIKRDDCACGTSRLINMGVFSLLTKEAMIAPYTITPYIAFILPDPEPVKQRNMRVEAYLDFKVGQAKLLPKFGDNTLELQKIKQAFAEVIHDKDLRIKDVWLLGYASPEGAEKFNKYLSHERAEALKNYLIMFYDYPADFYNTKFGGEDWGELTQLIEKSDMTGKGQILDIISDISDLDEREIRIRRLQDGIPYLYMLENFYPKLRRTVFQANYDVRQFNVEEAKKIVKIRPQNLSLNEMFLVAQTYEVGSIDFNNLFETAARLFPNDQTANINAALVAIQQKDLVKAERYLDKIQQNDSPEYNNAMGLLLMIRYNNFDLAEKYLRKAQEKGLKEATSNLKEMENAKDNYLIREEYRKMMDKLE